MPMILRVIALGRRLDACTVLVREGVVDVHGDRALDRSPDTQGVGQIGAESQTLALGTGDEARRCRVVLTIRRAAGPVAARRGGIDELKALVVYSQIRGLEAAIRNDEDDLLHVLIAVVTTEEALFLLRPVFRFTPRLVADLDDRADARIWIVARAGVLEEDAADIRILREVPPLVVRR